MEQKSASSKSSSISESLSDKNKFKKISQESQDIIQSSPSNPQSSLTDLGTIVEGQRPNKYEGNQSRFEIKCPQNFQNKSSLTHFPEHAISFRNSAFDIHLPLVNHLYFDKEGSPAFEVFANGDEFNSHQSQTHPAVQQVQPSHLKRIDDPSFRNFESVGDPGVQKNVNDSSNQLIAGSLNNSVPLLNFPINTNFPRMSMENQNRDSTQQLGRFVTFRNDSKENPFTNDSILSLSSVVQNKLNPSSEVKFPSKVSSQPQKVQIELANPEMDKIDKNHQRLISDWRSTCKNSKPINRGRQLLPVKESNISNDAVHESNMTISLNKNQDSSRTHSKRKKVSNFLKGFLPLDSIVAPKLANSIIQDKLNEKFNIYSKTYCAGGSLIKSSKDDYTQKVLPKLQRKRHNSAILSPKMIMSASNHAFHKLLNPNLHISTVSGSTIPKSTDSSDEKVNHKFKTLDILEINKVSESELFFPIVEHMTSDDIVLIKDINRALDGPKIHDDNIGGNEYDGEYVISDFITLATDKLITEEDIDLQDDVSASAISSGSKTPTSKLPKYRMEPDVDFKQLSKPTQLSETNGKYQQLILSLSNQKYNDDSFPPTNSSIFGYGESSEMYKLANVTYEWLRPEDVLGDDYMLYKDIDPSKAKQGIIGNCYFIAAICAIAANRERIVRIINSKGKMNEGAYSVSFCVNGVWEEVITDDLFPCVTNSKQFAFTQSSVNEIWLSVLGKCWAKIHGAYFNVSAGLTREVLRAMTGASCVTFFTRLEGDNLFDIMMFAYGKKYVITAGSDDFNMGQDTFVQKIGIAGCHAYSVLGVYIIAFDKKEGRPIRYEDLDNLPGDTVVERLVKLRNPWGKGEWTGDWSDSSEKWTPELRQALDVQELDDGIFHMSWEDFKQYFSDVQVCYYKEGYSYTSAKIQSEDNETQFFQIEFETTGEYFISVNQKNKRFFPMSAGYNYSPLSIFLAMEIDGKLIYSGCSVKADMENWVRIDPRAKGVFVSIKTPWRSFITEYVLSVYGPEVTKISRIVDRIGMNNAIKDIIIGFAESKDQLANHRDQPATGLVYQVFDTKGGLGFVYLKNTSNDKITVTVEMLNSINIQLKEPYRSLRPTIPMKPQQIEALLFEATEANYSVEVRVMSSKFKGPHYNSEKIKQLAQKFVIRFEGSGSGLYAWVLKYNVGAIILYENCSESLSANVEMSFDLSNCFLKHSTGSCLTFKIGPGEEHIVHIVKDPKQNEFSIKIRSLNHTF